MYKKIIITFLLIFSAFLVSDKVSAREISQFCEYTEPCLSTEDIDNFILEKNIDTSVYDKYVLTISKTTYNTQLHLSFFKSEDIVSNKVYVSIIDNNSYYLNMNDISFYSYQNIISIDSKFDDTALKGYQFSNYDGGNRAYQFSSDINSLVYYTNVDILDGAGNVVLEKNNYDISDYTDPVFTKKDLDNIIENNNIDTSVYDNYFIVFQEWFSSGVTSYDMNLYLFKNEDLDNIYILYDSYEKSYEFWANPSINLYYKNFSSSNKKLDISLYSLDMNFYNNWSMNSFTSSLTKNYIYYSNVDIKDNNGNITFPKRELPANNEDGDEEFTITIIDSEFDYNYGVNYVKGEQDNTINYYIQDSGILMDTHAKGHEIDKIYYDEELTKEAFIDDVLEETSTLYVTWKSKINITSEVKKDSSSNDVIIITYDFSKIYNDNYTYWVSNDGENYVDITSQLNDEKKYISDVYFFGRYYARVQDENNNTISVNHIRIKYYYISINTEVGSETDDDGNILPYIILDYSAYKNIKDNLIFEYSIDNGKSWINITNRLDSNLKYKLYVKIGDNVKTRVRTNGSTVLPGTSTGSDYVIDEDFINSLLTDDNFEFTLNKFLKPIKFIISSITEFYNDFCPPIVQNFLYLSFIILIVLFIIKLIW